MNKNEIDSVAHILQISYLYRRKCVWLSEDVRKYTFCSVGWLNISNVERESETERETETEKY